MRSSTMRASPIGPWWSTGTGVEKTLWKWMSGPPWNSRAWLFRHARSSRTHPEHLVRRRNDGHAHDVALQRGEVRTGRCHHGRFWYEFGLGDSRQSDRARGSSDPIPFRGPASPNRSFRGALDEGIHYHAITCDGERMMERAVRSEDDRPLRPSDAWNNIPHCASAAPDAHLFTPGCLPPAIARTEHHGSLPGAGFGLEAAGENR